MRPDHDVVIVGAGFGGIGAAIEFTRLGYDNIAILEREDDLAGTWHVNHYPGLAVDIASVTYSYSFEPNPNWSRLFAPGAELEQYAHDVADKYDLKRHMEFETSVDRAEWDDTEQLWRVHTSRVRDGGSPEGTTDAAVRTARYLVTATGFLSQPHTPAFPGIETFAGDIIHTTAWPDGGHDFTGERAAVIGTGATAVQLIPELARQAERLTVFQRTPIWVVPKVDFAIPPMIRRLFGALPVTQRVARMVNTSALELLMVFGVLHFQQAKAGNRAAALLAKAHLRAQVADPEMRRKLTPDYDFGCKRPTFSNTYLSAFNKPNVDLATGSIVRVEPDGIVTDDGAKTPVDTLVLATGFDLWDANFPAFEIIGRSGRSLGRWWREHRFQAYQGISVPQFPNLLSLNSPYSYSGLSYFTTIEGQMRHIRRLFGELSRRRSTTFEVTESANADFLDEMTDNLASSVFYAGNCLSARSYYYNQHGEATLLRPTSTRRTLRDMETFALSDYSYR